VAKSPCAYAPSHRFLKIAARNSLLSPKLNSDSALDLLLSLGMSQAELIVFTGGSAGGLTVFLHLDHVAARMKTEAPNARVVGEPVCGYFLDAGNDGS
jgi:hypothetical protein